MFRDKIRSLILIFCFIKSLGYCEVNEITSQKFDKDNQLLIVREMVHLSNYFDYTDISTMHFEVPDYDHSVNQFSLNFAFKAFQKSKHSSLFFKCKPMNLTLHLKYGSSPIVNPDGSKLPKVLANITTRPTIYTVQTISDNKYNVIKINSPKVGHWFAIAYIDWISPSDIQIQQSGLYPECYTNLLAYVTLKKENDSLVTQTNLNLTNCKDSYTTELISNNATLKTVYKINIDNYCDIKQYKLDRIKLINHLNDTPIELKFNQSKLIKNFKLFNENNFEIQIKNSKWLTNDFLILINNKNFQIDLTIELIDSKDVNDNNSIVKVFNVTKLIPYMLDLPIKYSYLLDPRLDINGLPIKIEFNLKEQLYVIKYKVDYENTAMPLIIDFQLVNSSYRNYTIVVCVSYDTYLLPMKLNTGECLQRSNRELSHAFRELNNSLSSSDGNFIAFPEFGDWYVSLAIFEIDQLECSFSCFENYENCVNYLCYENDENLFVTFKSCREECEQLLFANTCEKCNFSDVAKVRNLINTNITFSIGSGECVSSNCNQHGICNRHGTQIGLVTFTCICTGYWSGWDCSNDDYVEKHTNLIVGMVLLTVSNIFFLFSMFFAFKRKYYAECCVYACVMLSSTFYHACEESLTVTALESSKQHYPRLCIVNSLDVLQFCDFYCAIFGMWVTMVAISDIIALRSLLHTLGAIFIAFFVQLNRYSVFTFSIPALIGFVVITVNWVIRIKYRQKSEIVSGDSVTSSSSSECFYPNTRYIKSMIVGIFLMTVAIILYAFFETKGNYKYIHSIWHMLTAVSTCFFLPNKPFSVYKRSLSNNS